MISLARESMDLFFDSSMIFAHVDRMVLQRAVSDCFVASSIAIPGGGIGRTTSASLSSGPSAMAAEKRIATEQRNATERLSSICMAKST